MSDLATGAIFAGHRIEGVAGRGGMGVVYRAVQLRPERTVALKVIAPEFTDDAAFRARFERESQVAASIDNPNVLPLFQAGEEEGRLYISMRFVRGADLGQLLAAEGRLEPARVARIMDQIGYALDTAHQAGLVHRDIKPGNILIESGDRREHAYLTDFGLSKKTTSRSGMTATGMFVGTIDYMAPEQFEGGDLDARVDVYALGCVLFECLTGRIPYQRDTEPAKMFAHMTEPPPSVLAVAPDVPQALEAVVARAMAKKPDDRYSSAGDLARAALSAVEGRSLPSEDRVVATGEAAPGTVASPAPQQPVGQTQAAPPPPPVGHTVAAPPPPPADRTAAAPAPAYPPAGPPGAAPRAKARGGFPVPLVVGIVVLLIAAGAAAFLLLGGGGKQGGGGPQLSHSEYQDEMKTLVLASLPDVKRVRAGVEDADKIQNPTKAFAAFSDAFALTADKRRNFLDQIEAVTPPADAAEPHQRASQIWSTYVDELEQSSKEAAAEKIGGIDRFNKASDRFDKELAELEKEYEAAGYRIPFS
jgi:predicted Ser/Thr protein kinase